MGSTSVAGVAASGVLVVASGVVRYSSLFSSEIAVSKKLLTSDGAQTKTSVSLIKTGSSCPKTTRGVRLARQGCWCCACRSSSPVLQESYCRILSMWLQCFGLLKSITWSHIGRNSHLTSNDRTPERTSWYTAFLENSLKVVWRTGLTKYAALKFPYSF